MALSVLATIIYSCASKSNVPTAEVKKEETKKEVIVVKKEVVRGATVMTPELAEGMALYENNCAKCHKLYSPKDFSAEEWKPIVARMQKKAHLGDIEGQKILNYVTMK